MSQSAYSILILTTAILAMGPFTGSQALGQKLLEPGPRTGKVPSAGADAKPKTAQAAPATGGSPAPQDQDEVLPGSGSHVQSAPFYTVAEGFMTMLMLNNGTRAGFSVKATLYSLDGVPTELPPIHLNAHETKEVDLNEWVAGFGPQYASGSLRLDYQSIPYGLGAMVMMVNERQSIEVDVLARPSSEFKSNRLEAMWWKPERTTEVHYAIQNTADSQVSGKLTLTGSDGRVVKSVALDMSPHQTRVYKLHELLNDASFTDKVGGVSIEHQGHPGDLRAQSFILRRSIGFSASLQFEDPKAVVDSRLEGAGVLIGSEPTVGRPESFFGHLLVRNLSAEPVTVKARVQRNRTPTPMADVRLEAGEAREALVPPDSASSAEKEPGGAGLALQYTGAPGSVLAYWFSVDASGSLVVETPLRNPASLPQAGSNPWSLEGDYSSILYVKNTSTKSSSFVADIFYRGGYYMVGMNTLEAGETTAIDIRKLRDEQIPDVNGHKLPPRITAGQINWRTRNGEPRLIGRVNTMSVSKGLANNMSCSVCCACPSSQSVFFDPSSWIGDVGSTFSFSPKEQDQNNCALQTYPIPTASLAPWSSGNASVASVNQSTGVVSCQAGGGTVVSGDIVLTNTDVDLTNPPPIDACPDCISSTKEEQPSGPVTVNDFTVSPLNADVWDGNQGSFTVTISGGTASSYRWSFTAPAGAGNNPNVNFSASTSAQTNTDSHWFALPNVSCPPGDNPGAPARLAPYTITASVVFQGDSNAIAHTATLNSDFVWLTLARTGQASITGVPAMAADSSGTWHITGTGSMTRVLPVPNVLVPNTSQFYNKVLQHEQVHVNQWNPGQLLGDLYIVQDLFNMVTNFTGTSQADLTNQYNTALNNYDNTEVNIFNSRRNASEQQAYAVSDTIAPKYMIQNCGRF